MGERRRRVLVLAGDGIGPEVMGQAVRIIDWLNARLDAGIETVPALLGGCAYDRHAVPVTEETVDLARSCDALLVGAVGGPKYESAPFRLRPEQGLLRLRKEFDLYANLRPITCFDALATRSTLKPEVVEGLDLVIVRELTSGLYFGEPRGVFPSETGRKIGINTQRYTSEEIERVARFAFELARSRDKRLCSMDKANVMEAGMLWREELQDLHDAEFADVDLTHMYADNGAMQLVRNPRQFDVIVTDNLFGDILSDEAAMLTGSLGMLPSASIGDKSSSGRWFGLYEPVHGSAPDIAGKNLANPIACILSVAMALRYSLDMAKGAELIEAAIKSTLAQGVRTADLLPANFGIPVTTEGMGDAILAAAEDQLAFL
ncbi:3-isopropylmalate dehydrogenase [Mesorhizobium sp. L-8-10]|uniref:3-isopropylmalate dehydrogenase n=1 Tax=Mesorhizobium sp. L-8-10 TaxID=2744523 RepID=UPI0019296EF8|nr:3-isopropylmalate dehydrogenase [Mesorhizobium sp. L-8-10]